MRSKVLFVVFVLGLCGILTTSLQAQTLTARFNVPFDFVVSGKTMPAGEYAVGIALNHAGLVEMQSIDAHATAYAVTRNGETATKSGPAKLVFHRYGGNYFLADIDKGDAGTPVLAIPESRAEREAAKTARLEPIETLTLVAMR